MKVNDNVRIKDEAHGNDSNISDAKCPVCGRTMQFDESEETAYLYCNPCNFIMEAEDYSELRQCIHDANENQWNK